MRSGHYGDAHQAFAAGCGPDLAKEVTCNPPAAKPLSRIASHMEKGGLHRSLHVPMGEKIPAKRIRAAAKKKGKVGRQARLAQTFAKYRPK